MNELAQRAAQAFEQAGFSTRVFDVDPPMVHVRIEIGKMKEGRGYPRNSYFVLDFQTINNKTYWLVGLVNILGWGISDSLAELVQRAKSYNVIENALAASETLTLGRAFQVIQERTRAAILLQPGSTIHVYPGEYVDIRDENYKMRAEVMLRLIELESTSPPITLTYEDMWTITIHNSEAASKRLATTTLEEAVNLLIELLTSSDYERR